MRDFSFLPGPEKMAPHLADRAWIKCITKEEDFALAAAQNRSMRRNPIAWDDVSIPNRFGTGYSDHSANVLSLDCSRTNTAATTMTVGFQSARSSRSSRSRASG